MFVSRLDRPWLDTPFLLQGFRIEGPEDVQTVAQYCQHVWIDTDRSTKSSPSEPSVSFAPIKKADHSIPVEEEHKRIHLTFRKARTVTKDFLGSIRRGQDFDLNDVMQTVDDCVQSVLRNPDALVWMSKIREENEYTAEHSLNVCILAVVFGRQLGMSAANLELLGLCGLLHDIGKMRVPNEILDKPAALTDKEMNMMKAHTVHGRNLLLSTPAIDARVVDASYSHHERVDGTGYPRKLPADQISYFTRIISIVDAYDAMTADRCYCKAKPTTKALKIIYEERGKQFDEELSLQFIKTIGLFPVGSIVELYTGEIGIVIETNQNMRHLPRVMVVLDEHQQQKVQPKVINLANIEEGDMSQDYLIKHVWADGHLGVYLKTYQEHGLLLKY